MQDSRAIKPCSSPLKVLNIDGHLTLNVLKTETGACGNVAIVRDFVTPREVSHVPGAGCQLEILAVSAISCSLWLAADNVRKATAPWRQR
ncbi:hypothetical protein BKA67DRAFT_358081 [Truncatella angustata]|uniref:Uncharacterized protein n=1 Tax=Truncatella angustata TaxID=152316 RepID=A0A9P8UE49_9PEZI|nr:uncharacterized protein BKA67DRAFT_358081 [Truncatella angustata]KAH6648254.1 hypothetical protein BKA67DRAFT_358081 [Truncatella angustata]